MSTATLTSRNPTLSTARLRPIARESSQKLSRFTDHDLDVQITGTKEVVTLPVEALRLIVDLLAQLAQGNAVTLVPYHAEMTTQQAAEFLGVSRPFIVKQLESGQIPFRKVGTHRRILFEELLKYKQNMQANRLKALDELSGLDQELGLH
jgi:excisionase family DNA binding protein